MSHDCMPPLLASLPPRHGVFACRFILAAGAAEVGGEAVVAPPSSPNSCPLWSDAYGFDCQLYEGADWCTSQGQLGAGWCQANQYQPSYTDKTCLPNAQTENKWKRKFGWGSFSDFLSAGELTPGEACAGCGAPCSAPPPARIANALPAHCSDLATPDGSGVMWRDSWGYTCASYQHGSFCVQAADSSWGEGGLWDASYYGDLEGYKWWAVRADGSAAKVHALEACCACGGGTISEDCDGLEDNKPCKKEKKVCNAGSRQNPRKCKKLCKKKKQRKNCKMTCCEPPSPSPSPSPPPPPPQPKDCNDRTDTGSVSKCKNVNKCNKAKHQKKCEKTCCKASSPSSPSPPS